MLSIRPDTLTARRPYKIVMSVKTDSFNKKRRHHLRICGCQCSYCQPHHPSGSSCQSKPRQQLGIVRVSAPRSTFDKSTSQIKLYAGTHHSHAGLMMRWIPTASATRKPPSYCGTATPFSKGARLRTSGGLESNSAADHPRSNNPVKCAAPALFHQETSRHDPAWRTHTRPKLSKGQNSILSQIQKSGACCTLLWIPSGKSPNIFLRFPFGVSHATFLSLCRIIRLIELASHSFSNLRQYRQAAHYNITHLRRLSFYSLPSAHVDILSEPPLSLPDTFRAVDDAIDKNAEIAESILEFCLPSFGIDAEDVSWHGQATPNDMDKARSTIRQIYRDWSAEGSNERNASHQPIFSALSTHLSPDTPSQRYHNRILVPGAGLGRLVLDLCALGYDVEGNEISYHQILASNYMLNGTQAGGQHLLYPWALNFSNHMTRAYQLQSVVVPDVNPGSYLEEGGEEKVQSELHYSQRLSMTSGDFSALYRQAEYQNRFQAVVTCFFIDTAPNVIAYIETVKHCLSPGGVWINIGPLLWHFESSPTPAEREKRQHSNSSLGQSNENRTKQVNEGIGEPGSFELSNDEVLALLKRFGFEIVSEAAAPGGQTGYIQDPRSMLQNLYQPSFWVAKKPAT